MKTKCQGKEAEGGKSTDCLLSSLVAYNGLFVSQYHILNLEHSFLQFLVKKFKINAIIFLSFVPNDRKRVELTSPAVPTAQTKNSRDF